MKKIILYLVPILVLCAFVLVFFLFIHKAGKVKDLLKVKPIPVALEKITGKDWVPTIEATGNVLAKAIVEVTTQSGGLVTKKIFESGDTVKAGDVLVELDDTTEQASLKQNQALLFSKKLTYERNKQLVSQGAVSRSDFDNSQAAYLAQQAQVDNDQAQIKLLKIIAPFSGQLGISNLQLGQYVNAGANVCQLVDLSQMYINFSISQKDIGDIKLKQNIEIMVDTYPDKKFVGNISTISPSIASGTGMINLQAIANNKEELLRSGMYVTVNIIKPTLTKQIVIPQTAVRFTTYGDSVFVVDKVSNAEHPNLTVKPRDITVVDRKNGLVLVGKGLKAGEEIVSIGEANLSAGSIVREVDEKLPRKDLPEL